MTEAEWKNHIERMLALIHDPDSLQMLFWFVERLVVREKREIDSSFDSNAGEKPRNTTKQKNR